MIRTINNIGHEEQAGVFRVYGTVANKATVPGETVAAQPARVVFYEGKSYPAAMGMLEELRTAMISGGPLPEPAPAPTTA